MLRTVKLLPTWKPLITTARNLPYPMPFIHLLRNSPQAQYAQLPNGLRVVTLQRECINACIGIFIDAGSRHENNFENGITHFFEHLAFKGTKARSKTVLESQMSSTAAKFKCFTTREMACYYVEYLCQDTPLIFDILTDCIFNNSFNPVVMEREKKIVYQEMLEHDRNTNDLLFDYLHTIAYQGTPLAQSVMGPSSNLYNFCETTISNYLRKCFDPSKAVVVGVGGVSHDQLVGLAREYINKLDPIKCVPCELARFTGSEVRYRDDNLQLVNMLIAVEGPSLCHKDKVVLDVAASIVGGWEKSQGGADDHGVPVANAAASGLCHAYKSFQINYKDTGLWGCHILAEPLDVNDMLLTVQDQWMHMCNSITDIEVERAKHQLKTKVLSRTESSVGVCHEIGKWVLYRGSRPQLDETICAIDGVYAKDIHEVCTKYIYDRDPVVVAIGPTEGLSDYTRIRAGMYWLRV